MLVYDVTTEKSFENIRNWIRNIEEVGVSSGRGSSGWVCWQGTVFGPCLQWNL